MTAQERQVVENKISELKKEEFAMRKTMHVGCSCGCDK